MTQTHFSPSTQNLEKLRVVLVSTQKAWHGGEAQASLLAAGLRDLGHEVFVLARNQTPFPREMASQGYETATFAGRGRSPLGLWQIRRNLQRLRPDVVFYNDPHSLTAGTLAGVGLSIPVRLAARRVDFTIRSTWRYLHGCQRVVCVSEAVAEACREGGIPDAMLRVVHDGVDPGRIEQGNRNAGRVALSVNDDEPLILTVAKLTDHKGHIYLLNALPKILATIPKAKLAFAGDGELRDALQAEANRLGIAKQVQFLGYRQDVPDLMHAADIIVAPSHLEGLNTSIIDAMLAAKPIVTTSAGGIPDLTGCREPAVGPAAWVVPPKDPTALSDAVIQAIQQSTLAQQLGAYAQRRAKERFTARQMVNGTLSVIEEVLCETRTQAA